MGKKITSFIKREIVFSIACILAIISSFIVLPSKEYIGYINFQTLGLLLALMLVVQGLNSCGLFSKLVSFSMQKISTLRQLTIVMVVLCFITSMFITNDVSLITFVPFSIILLDLIDNPKYSIKLIVLETMAANLGSMFTPIGNPQNLYLYSVSGFTLLGFLKITLPYTVISFVLLIISSVLVKNEPICSDSSKLNDNDESTQVNKSQLAIFIILFCVCILTVLGILDYKIMLLIVLGTIFIINKRLIPKADYILLLTFVAFFIFIGNMKNIDVVHNILSDLVKKRECIVGVLTSQVVSNVPAAVLLSGFTTKYKDLIIGVNLGGLGTLIASMASLISYKFYVKSKNNSPKKYILYFLELSVIYLIVLLAFYYILK